MNKKLINAVAKQIGGLKELKNHASDICNYGAAGGFNGFISFLCKALSCLLELL